MDRLDVIATFVRVAELANQVRELNRVVTALRSGGTDPSQLKLDGFHG